LFCGESFVKAETQDRVKAALSDAVLSGSSASVLSAAVLSTCSKIEEGSAAGGLNGPSQWFLGEEAAYAREASLKQTGLGYGIHHTTSIFWATFYEYFCGRSNGDRLQRITPGQVVIEAATMATAAYVVDYALTPKRLQPGFDKHISPVGMVATYTAFAAGLAITTLLRQRQRKASAS
jgi:hypothetical protein